jgi:para-nitrobenzyl esterase
MITAWTNFVKFSDPNGDGEGLGWKPCTEKEPGFMIFKLDEKDAEASKMGEPIIPEPTPMPDRK